MSDPKKGTNSAHQSSACVRSEYAVFIDSMRLENLAHAMGNFNIAIGSMYEGHHWTKLNK
jgi:hypothetical protein